MNRDVVCQLPPEAGHPPYIAARLKKPGHGMNDAPPRWWNFVDKALCSYGMVPTRADRCCYVLYSRVRETQREVNMDRPFESRLHIDYSTNNHHSQLHSKNCPDCCFIAILSRRKPTGPRLMRRLWSNTRERTQSNEREQAEDSSYPKAIEGLLTETARKGYPDPEEVDNPMIAPQDHEIHQSRGVLELQNRDLLATTHRSILVPSYSCDYP